jgi:hypothetical protein
MLPHSPGSVQLHAELLSLPLGALDDDPGIRPHMNVYVASKAQWFTIYAERKLVRSDG